MSDIAIKMENLGKLYRLGEIGTGTISHDLNRAWARLRGKEDPLEETNEPYAVAKIAGIKLLHKSSPKRLPSTHSQFA